MAFGPERNATEMVFSMRLRCCSLHERQAGILILFGGNEARFGSWMLGVW
jgi:hypothetical protein